MGKRLQILFEQERNPLSAFSAEYLAELMEETPEEINALAAREQWQSLEMKEVGPEGGIEAVPMWDALSMPYDRRKRIAALHHSDEEAELSLAAEAETEAEHIQKRFPWVDANMLSDAIFCARLFTYARDVAFSLKLRLDDALEVLCHTYGIPADRIIAFNNQLDDGDPCSFILLDEDTRLAALLLFLLHNEQPAPDAEHDAVEQQAE